MSPDCPQPKNLTLLSKAREIADKTLLKDNEVQLWATTDEYAAAISVSRRTVQDWIKTHKIKEKIRNSNKTRGQKGYGYEILIKDAEKKDIILGLREEQKTNPRNKEIDRLNKELNKANKDISELKKEVVALCGISNELNKCRTGTKALIKRYDKKRTELEEALEAAKSNANEAVKADHKAELDEKHAELVGMSLAVKEKEKDIGKLKGDILRLKDQITAWEVAAKASTMARMDIQKQLEKEREHHSDVHSKMDKVVSKLYEMSEGDIKNYSVEAIKGVADNLKELLIEKIKPVPFVSMFFGEGKTGQT